MKDEIVKENLIRVDKVRLQIEAKGVMRNRVRGTRSQFVSTNNDRGVILVGLNGVQKVYVQPFPVYLLDNYTR